MLFHRERPNPLFSGSAQYASPLQKEVNRRHYTLERKHHSRWLREGGVKENGAGRDGHAETQHKCPWKPLTLLRCFLAELFSRSLSFFCPLRSPQSALSLCLVVMVAPGWQDTGFIPLSLFFNISLSSHSEFLFLALVAELPRVCSYQCPSR